jgi:hypothetical protein
VAATPAAAMQGYYWWFNAREPAARQARQR